MSKKSAKSSGKSAVKNKKTAKAKPVKKAAAKPQKKAVKKAKPAPKPAKKKVIVKTKSKVKAKPVKAKPAPKAKAAPVKKAVKKAVAKPVKKIVPAPKAKAIKPVVKKAIATTIAVKSKAPIKSVTKPEPKKAEVKVAAKPIPPEVKVAPSSKKGKIAPMVKESTGPVIKQATLLQTLKHDVSSIDKPVKEPAGKFELEYVVHASAPILFEFLTSPSGLSEWFCDDLNIRNGVFSFVWDGSVQQARLIKIQEDKHIRFQWMDKPEGTYFEFRIERDDLTGDISLIVTDFADTKDDATSSRLLWDSQIHRLMQVLGSYY